MSGTLSVCDDGSVECCFVLCVRRQLIPSFEPPRLAWCVNNSP